MDSEQSLQDRYAPHSLCFGCGPANSSGLRIKSFAKDGHWETKFRPQPMHQAFPGMVNGGIIGALMDCHSNWAACHHLQLRDKLPSPPCTVTADFHVTLKRPCPLDAELLLIAKVTRSEGAKVWVEATLEAEGKIRATCTGTFVAVEPGHPAYHRW